MRGFDLRQQGERSKDIAVVFRRLSKIGLLQTLRTGVVKANEVSMEPGLRLVL